MKVVEVGKKHCMEYSHTCPRCESKLLLFLTDIRTRPGDSHTTEHYFNCETCKTSIGLGSNLPIIVHFKSTSIDKSWGNR